MPFYPAARFCAHVHEISWKCFWGFCFAFRQGLCAKTNIKKPKIKGMFSTDLSVKKDKYKETKETTFRISIS